ncbi:hypothetical protein Pelo_16290 [Pelomyxa schiedti]|nr:hypothetical protein Pelo_16290 [Pelomyxa schiedti]
MAGVTTGAGEGEVVGVGRRKPPAAARRGSEYEYVDAGGCQCDVRYMCAGCGRPANAPVLHDCAACFCLACASNCGESRCSVCDEKIEGNTKPLTAKSVLAKLSTIEVFCPVCKTAVKRDSLDDHIQTCTVGVLLPDCPRGCGLKVPPQNQTIHENEECLNALVTCKACNELVQRKLISNGSHLALDCPTDCKNGCGKKVKPRDQQDHNTTCTCAMVKCSSQYCPWEGPRSEQQGHLASCTIVKVTPLVEYTVAAAMKALSEKNTALQNQITTIIAENQHTKDTLHKLEEKYNKLALALTGKVSVLEFSQTLKQVDPPEGIMMNVPQTALKGWNMHYRQPYSHPTQPSDIDPGKGEWILVASQKIGEDVLSLCAIGKRSAVCTRTTSHDTATLHRGIYWYFVENSAFGFAPSSTIKLKQADLVDKTTGWTRLSWHLHGIGGYRSGTTRINKSNAWEKLVYWM